MWFSTQIQVFSECQGEHCKRRPAHLPLCRDKQKRCKEKKESKKDTRELISWNFEKRNYIMCAQDTQWKGQCAKVGIRRARSDNSWMRNGVGVILDDVTKELLQVVVELFASHWLTWQWGSCKSRNIQQWNIRGIAKEEEEEEEEEETLFVNGMYNYIVWVQSSTIKQ